MCHACIIESVKARALNRRDLFRGAAATALAATAATTAAAPRALAQGARTVEDLSFELSDAFPTYFGQPGIKVEREFSFAADGFNLNRVNHNEHVGTHVDAPLHFSGDGQSAAEIPVGRLVAPLCVVDIRAKSDADPDAQVTPDDLKAWIAANGPIPEGACVAMLSGWGARVSGDGYRNADAEGKMHFPGFHVEAAKMLIEETGAIGIGVDTLSLDHGPSGDFATHYAWLPTNRWGIECLANLERLPATGATLIVGMPKVKDGTGGPARVLALV